MATMSARPNVHEDVLWAVLDRLHNDWFPVMVDNHAYPKGTWVPCNSEGHRRMDVEPELMTDDEQAVIAYTGTTWQED